MRPDADCCNARGGALVPMGARSRVCLDAAVGHRDQPLALAKRPWECVSSVGVCLAGLAHRLLPCG